MRGGGAAAATPLLVRALRGEEVERVPAWIMRQAGRYLPEYRELRARHGFLECCTTPALAAEITLQPMRRFPLDAAILFADIMTPLDLAGVPIEFAPGPRLAAPVRDGVSAAALGDPAALARRLEGGYLRETFALIRAGLPAGAALLGFAGSPFTVACYVVEGGGGKGEFPALRRLARTDAAALRVLLDRIAEFTIAYLREQVAAGADAVQVFDSWGGILDGDGYAAWDLPWIARIVDALRPSGVPVILYAGGAGGRLPAAAATGVHALSVDHREPLDSVRARVGGGVVLQGNLDPAALFAPADALRAEVARVLRAGGGRRHVFNLGHGIWPETPMEGVSTLLDAVRAGGPVSP